MATKNELTALLPTLGKRPRTVLKLLLEKGDVSTHDLGKLGYDQPPRAAQDLKDAGVTLVRKSGTNPDTGNRMAVYSIDWSVPIGRGSSERKAFPKAFVRAVKETYGGKCCIYQVEYPHSALQVDHRIPFQIAGDPDRLAVEDFMSLCPSANRSKSWACEHCPNFQAKDVEVCRTCYWAYPDSDYLHIATVEEKQILIKWLGKETVVYDSLEKYAAAKNITTQQAIKQIVREVVERERWLDKVRAVPHRKGRR